MIRFFPHCKIVLQDNHKKKKDELNREYTLRAGLGLGREDSKDLQYFPSNGHQKKQDKVASTRLWVDQRFTVFSLLVDS